MQGDQFSACEKAFFILIWKISIKKLVDAICRKETIVMELFLLSAGKQSSQI